MTERDQAAAGAADDRAPYEETVRPEWIDYNGHMNVAYYLLVFDHASDALLDRLDLGLEHRNRENRSMFVVEAHITYQREVLEGDGLRVNTRILGYDNKRLHLFHQMFHAASAEPVAGNEVMLLHVDMAVRKTVEFSPASLERIEPIYRRQRDLAPPAHAGQAIKMPPPPVPK